MESGSLLGLVALVLAAVSGGLLMYFMAARPRADFRSLMVNNGTSNAQMAELRQRLEDDETGMEYEKVKSVVRGRYKRSSEPTFQEKMFRAGIFSEQQKRDFRRIQLLGPFVGPITFAVIGAFLGGLDVILLFGSSGGK
jgi:hypothetical protein